MGGHKICILALCFPRILALATINMLRDGAREIYQEENKVLRYKFYALCVLHWEVFSLHSKHWGWALAKYLKLETILSTARPPKGSPITSLLYYYIPSLQNV